MKDTEKEETHDKKYYKIIDNISLEEIDNSLKRYKIAENIFGYSSYTPFLFGLSTLLLSVGKITYGGFFVLLGLGKFGYEAIMLDGLYVGGGLTAGCFGIGLGLFGIAYIFEKIKEKKDKNKEKIVSFIEKLKEKTNTESSIYNSFLKDLSDFLSKELSILIKNEYDLLIKILNNLELDSQEIFNNIGKMLLIKIKDRFTKFHEYDKLSILVLGKTGVGKTTLINSILNKETNEERIGLPDEMDEDFIKKYNRESFPSLDIWDSRGIELSQKFNIEKYSEQKINFLKKGYENKEINNIKKQLILFNVYGIV